MLNKECRYCIHDALKDYQDPCVDCDEYNQFVPAHRDEKWLEAKHVK